MEENQTGNTLKEHENLNSENYTIYSEEALESLDAWSIAANPNVTHRRFNVIKIQNCQDNTEWPLDYCPKCNNDLLEKKPKVISLLYPLLLFVDIFLSLFITLIFFLIFGTVLKDTIALILLLSFIFSFLVLSLYFKTGPKFYICSVCHCLLFHNKTADKVILEFDNKYKRIFGEYL